MKLLFSLSSLTVMPFWLMMIFAPHATWTRRVMASLLVFVAPALLYSILILPSVPTLLPVFMSPELSALQPLLGSELGATVAWIHFLAFDLFVARWIFTEAHARFFSFVWVSPVLFLTLMFGPLGLLTFLCVRAVLLRGQPSPTQPSPNQPSPNQPSPTQKNTSSSTLNMVGSAGTPNPTLAGRGLDPASASRWETLRETLREPLRMMRKSQPGLYWLTVAMVPLALISLLGLLLDPRQIGGDPAWLKPLKFSLSVFLFGGSMLDVLRRLDAGKSRWLSRLGNTLALALTVEWGVILLQVLRGQPSHFNVATPLDASLFSLMAVFIVLLWGVTVGLFGMLLRQRSTEPVFDAGLRWGLGISLLGAMVGFLMTASPKPDQKLLLEQGFTVQQIGGHAVGVADGGPGLPGVGWSTEGGDLRVPHFWGLHALQGLPLLAWGLRRRFPAEVTRARRLVQVAGLSWLGGLGLLTWQALRGQPVLAPDAWTWAGVGILLVLTLSAAGWVWRRPTQVSAAPVLAQVG
ncbi:MAG: ABA4-like family protein [Myxococcota bacterium]